jgi:hypothetical protein
MLLGQVHGKDEEDDGVDLPLPDSTPGVSEDSLDSYAASQRLSPSPMAHLHLAPADSTTARYKATLLPRISERPEEVEGACK